MVKPLEVTLFLSILPLSLEFRFFSQPIVCNEFIVSPLMQLELNRIDRAVLLLDLF